MSEGIFHLGEDGKLMELRPQGFINEDDFQELLARHPRLLPGNDSNESGDRWLLIQREAGVPDAIDGGDRWSLDHLFVDREGIPTLVEVKRSTDSRIRREVVGQMLDYAANAIVYWPVDRLRFAFESRCQKESIDPLERLVTFLGDDADPEVFWTTVKTNLQAGKVRMIFVADVIPKELQRIVEFLNVQMDPAEVLAVELRQYVGGNTRSLVPRLIGQTAEAVTRKRASEPNEPTDEITLLARVKSETGDGAARLTKELLDWARHRADDVSFGSQSYSVKFKGLKGLRTVFSCWGGTFSVAVDALATIEPFQDDTNRTAFLQRFALVPGAINNPKIKNPGIRLAETAEQNGDSKLLEFLNGFVDTIRAAPPTAPQSAPSAVAGSPVPAG